MMRHRLTALLAVFLLLLGSGYSQQKKTVRTVKQGIGQVYGYGRPGGAVHVVLLPMTPPRPGENNFQFRQGQNEFEVRFLKEPSRELINAESVTVVFTQGVVKHEVEVSPTKIAGKHTGTYTGAVELETAGTWEVKITYKTAIEEGTVSFPIPIYQ